MAYTPTSWVDRIVQYANRFTKSGETSTEVTLTASPGTITAAGTPISAANLNKIEQGIDDAHALNVDDVTVSDTTAPTGDTAAPKTLLNWIANMIKQITGKANWRTAPRTTLENAVKLNGDTMTGSLGLQHFGGSGGFENGNADAASYTQHNFALKGWWGMGMKTYDNSVNGYYDFRTGKWVTKAGFTVNDGTTDKLVINSAGDIIQRGTTTAPTRVTSGVMEFWDGGAWKPVGGVKSIQRGRTANTTASSTDITISAVTMGKSQVNLLSSLTHNTFNTDFSLELISSTVLRFHHPGGITAGNYNISWEVVESY